MPKHDTTGTNEIFIFYLFYQWPIILLYILVHRPNITVGLSEFMLIVGRNLEFKTHLFLFKTDMEISLETSRDIHKITGIIKVACRVGVESMNLRYNI